MRFLFLIRTLVTYSTVIYVIISLLYLFKTMVFPENHSMSSLHPKNTISQKESSKHIGNADKYRGNQTSIAEYVRFYKLDNKIHSTCVGLTRPQPDNIRWRKNTYQHFYVKLKDFPPRDAYVMKFYLDDRFPGERFFRAIFTVHGIGFLTKTPNRKEEVWRFAFALYSTPYWVLLWYRGFRDPILANCRLGQAGGLDRKVGGTVFSQHMIICKAPEIAILPRQASIIEKPCDNKPENLIDIVYPEPRSHPSERRIGICMASLYGSLDDQKFHYFVNWMETLTLFGVSDVTVNNASLKIHGRRIKKAFDYYISKGRLKMTHFPPVHLNWTSPKEDDAATEAINRITTSDCFYRNVKKYWYTLIIDLDELPVPSKERTYQEFLENYFHRHPTMRYAHSLGIRSAFFYLDFEPGNPDYGEHLPVLRQTRRFRIEPMEVDGAGLSKAFHNNRNVVASGHHQARASHPPGTKIHHEYFDPEDILIHHYRQTCKYSHYCKQHWNETILDGRWVKKFGPEIQHRVKTVLNDMTKSVS